MAANYRLLATLTDWCSSFRYVDVIISLLAVQDIYQIENYFNAVLIITRHAQRDQTPPMLLHCLGDRGCIVGEKRGGAPCRVKIHRIKTDLRYVDGSRKLIVHPAPDQHQKLITSTGLTLAHLMPTVFGRRLLPSSWVILLTDRQTDRQNGRTNDLITTPALAV